MIVLGTAHPAKFPDAVMAASGIHPDLPSRSKDLMSGQERFKLLENDLNFCSRPDSCEAYLNIADCLFPHVLTERKCDRDDDISI